MSSFEPTHCQVAHNKLLQRSVTHKVLDRRRPGFSFYLAVRASVLNGARAAH